ncbi:MAG: AAA family ATPase [Chthoniobacter sp.]|uniref:AAA family ATPase n=1 Tax=Chthoniobacter sp. TaxID=2510640 RepID=UPI0032AA806B
MTTRHASEDSEKFRQERYMSSPEMQRGLLANCVAARVQVLTDPLHRKLVWWLQKVSWQPGGLEQLAAELIQRWPERFATVTMQRLGIGAGRIYSAEEVTQAQGSLRGKTTGWAGAYNLRRAFPLRGEVYEPLESPWAREDDEDRRKWSKCRSDKARTLRKSRAYPKTYPASDFAEYCLEEARKELAKFLFEKLCLDPEVRMDESPLWYFPGLVGSLAELHDLHAEAAASAPVTEIGAKIAETMGYALAERGLVVIDGLARTGKTFAVKAWCQQNPGQARYVQVPSSNDDMSFFRALAEALGIGTSHAYKALELRGRIETVLHTGDLLLVLDEGHYLWPQRNMRKAVPHRINWMLTQLVNMGVPVAVVTTPQFTKSQEALVRGGGWSSEQLVGRIIHYEQLPSLLGEDDLQAVARHWLPGADNDAVATLTAYAQSSEKYLQGIEALARRSRFLANKANRSEPTFQDVVCALKESVVPSDNAIAAALTGARSKPRKKAAVSPATEAVQSPCRASARIVQPSRESTFKAPARDAGASVLTAQPT